MTSLRSAADATGTGRPPQRFLSLEAGRFVAALAVVLFHVGTTTAEPKHLGYWVVPAFAGGFSGVEFFFVLSGFVIVTAHYADLRSTDRTRVTLNFLWKRFIRLYPALWCVLAVLVPLIALRRSLQWNGPISAADIAAAFAIVPVSVEKILSVEWTLRYEVLFYAGFALLLWRRTLGATAFLVMAGAALASYAIDADGLPGFFITPYPLLFIAGCAIGLLARRGRLPLAGPALVLGSAVFLWRIGICAAQPAHRDGIVGDATFFGLAAILLVYGLVAWESRRAIAVPAVLLYLGQASYAIYLVHFPLVSLGARLLMRLRSPHVPDAALIAAIAALAVAGGTAYHALVERRLVRLARRFRPALLNQPRASDRPTIVGDGAMAEPPAPPSLQHPATARE